MTKARDLANIISGGFTESDIPNLATSKITSGTFADARLPATALNSNVDLTTLSASNLTSGTVADARLPATVLNSNVDLTNLSASNMTSGTLPDARFPSTLPAISGANLTNVSGGKLLQVVSVTWKDAFSSTAKEGTFAAITGASATITPSATSSKILVTTMLNTSGSVYGQYINLLRGGSVISGAQGAVSGNRVAMTAFAGTPNDAAEMDTCHINYLDSPSSTSAVTYSLSGSARHNTTWTVNYPYEDSNHVYTGHAVSTITLMEIGA